MKNFAFSNRYDVIVVGGGPAGATASRRLSEAGLRVIMIERDLKRKKPCGGGMPSTLFREFQLPEDLSYKSVNSVLFVSPSGKRLEIGLRGGHLRVVERGEFDSLLRGLAEQRGCKVMEAVVRGVEVERRIKVKVLHKNGSSVIEADYLVAADGVNSAVRGWLGLKPLPYVYTLSSRMNVKGHEACEFWFGKSHAPGAYSWIFPRLDGVSVGTGTDEPKRAKRCLKEFLKRVGYRAEPENMRLQGYKIPLWNGGPIRKNRVFFVGDAAGQVMPLTFEGIYYAMKSADFVAQAIAQETPHLYERLWKGRFLSRFRFMKLLQGYFLKSDRNAEKLVSIFSSAEMQELSMRLWLKKEQGRGVLISFIKRFGKFVH